MGGIDIMQRVTCKMCGVLIEVDAPDDMKVNVEHCPACKGQDRAEYKHRRGVY